MNVKIKVKRGTKAQIENTVLQIGELVFATDTKELYIGTATGKIKLIPKEVKNDN